MSCVEGPERKTVLVVGGGLVGALQACFMAKRGYTVAVYEMRQDIRTMEVVRGRSINLALSVRGREALRMVGVDDIMETTGIPMYARMIHDRDGKRRPIQYGNKDQFIMSVDRRHLNEILLTEAEKYPTVSMYFEHKMVECNCDIGTATFQKTDGSKVLVTTDLIIGCDGAYSKVRQQMMKKTLFDYEQVFIPHGYLELNMPPAPGDKFAMEINYLHIWARDDYMMIALPNYDKSFTVTLFMPFDNFKALNTDTDVLDFFRTNFADSIPLLGEKHLIETVTKNKALPLITVKCSPYNVKDKIVIMGDAAHAMCPFYGQGMNCGFEDCIVFNDILDEHNDDFGATLREFTSYRSVDAKAMCDLAFYNYIEMRHSVNSRMFLVRKKIDNFLFWLFPNTWVPLYTSVSFTRKRYHECIKNREWQDRMIQRFLYLCVPALAFAGYNVYKHLDRMEVPLHEKLVQFAERLRSSWI